MNDTIDDLIAFVRARLDEDERWARWIADRDAWHGIHVNGPTEVAMHIERHDPARVLRQVEAMRRIMDEALQYEAKIDGEWGCCHDVADIAVGECPETPPNKIASLRALAATWSDHPDYREEWAP